MHFELSILTLAAAVFIYFNVYMRRSMKPEVRNEQGAIVRAYFAPRKYLTETGRKYRIGALVTLLMAWLLSELVYQLQQL
ncbi:MAG: hypothetical protein WEB37_04610 [Bacteroidota bacterium]